MLVNNFKKIFLQEKQSYVIQGEKLQFKKFIMLYIKLKNKYNIKNLLGKNQKELLEIYNSIKTPDIDRVLKDNLRVGENKIPSDFIKSIKI